MNAKSVLVTLAAAAALAPSAYAAAPLPVKADNSRLPGAMPLSRADMEMQWTYGSVHEYEMRDTDWELVYESRYAFDSEGNNVENTYTSYGRSNKTEFSDFVDGLPGKVVRYTKYDDGDYEPMQMSTYKYDSRFYGVITEIVTSNYNSTNNTWREPYVSYRRDIETDDSGRLMIWNDWDYDWNTNRLYLQQGIEYHYADASSREPIGFTIRWYDPNYPADESSASNVQAEVTGLTWERYDSQTTAPLSVLELSDPDSFRPLTATVTRDGVTTVTTYTYDGDLSTAEAVSGSERTVFMHLSTGERSYRSCRRLYVDGVAGQANFEIIDRDRFDLIERIGYFQQTGTDDPITGNITRFIATMDTERDVVSERLGENAGAEAITEKCQLEDLIDYDFDFPESAWRNASRSVYGDWVQIPVKNAIESVEEAAAGNEGEIEYFTLDGRRVVNPVKGIVIERRGTKVTKRVVR